MSFISCYEKSNVILMEGALGERLKREFSFAFDENVGLGDIIYRAGGREALLKLWKQYISIAEKYELPFIATTPTRRSNRERVKKAGYDESLISDNVDFLKQVQRSSGIEMYVGGMLGCYGDAYKATDILASDEAEEFHSWQAELFKEAGVDFLYAALMPALSEAEGMARALEKTQLPYIISFMIRDNGRLPDGTSINDAIAAIDASVSVKPVCYMTNCVHPGVLYKALSLRFNRTALIGERFHGIQANTSTLSPEELDNSIELKCSNAADLAKSMYRLRELIDVKIAGGCCGTDDTHIKEIAKIFSL